MNTTASRTVLITGAANGIGRATALAFARAGDRVARDRDADAAACLVAELEAAGGSAHFASVDVSCGESMVARTPVGRMGEPEDIARASLFFADEGAGFVSGSVLSVDARMVVGS